MDAVDRPETEQAELQLSSSLATDPPPNRHDPYAALRFRDFKLLLVGRFIATLGEQMLVFAVGWELWIRTHNELALGLIGLVQVIPVIVLSLPAGHVADQYNRKRIIFVTQVLLASCSIGLALLSVAQGSIALVYICLLGIGIARSFNGPATSTILPQTVPPEMFSNAATWSSSSWQLAAVIGPALAGIVVGLLNSVTELYIFDAIAGLTFLVMVSVMRSKPIKQAQKSTTLDSLAEGARFIRTNKVILAAITLDMFAVLFGGAVTLLPVYATDVLHVGPEGLGIMRAAPSIGALLMAFFIAHRPPFKRAGITLLWAVAGFGLATIVFGVSKSFILSIAMLALLGGLDNISVVIRSTLLLVRTPDEMRGRISSINSIFLGMSNEMGGFESGLAASLIGPVGAVVFGGVGTILVVLGIARVFPEMVSLKQLSNPHEDIQEAALA
jgi:MFS family permease